MTARERASADVYRSARLAAGYAVARPPVHVHVVRLIAARLGVKPAARPERALDVGCGAGLSTAPLVDLAGSAVGIEPAVAMLEHRRRVAPRARFVAGAAETLPFRDGSFDLVTCAGALNYTDEDRALREIGRVLTAAGTLVVYDFSSGRRCAAADLEGWFGQFERRYPYPTGYALDVPALDYRSGGLRLSWYESFEVALPMTLHAYLAYVLSETNVQRAVTAGVPERDIADWCRGTLEPLFRAGFLEVWFDGYIAGVQPTVSEHGGDP